MVNHVQVRASPDKKDEIIEDCKIALLRMPGEILEHPNSRVAR